MRGNPGEEGLRGNIRTARRTASGIPVAAQQKMQTSLSGLTWCNPFTEWLLVVASLRRHLCSKAAETLLQFDVGSPL